MPKPPMPVLQDERVRLRPLAAEDLPMTLSWRNQDVVRRWFLHSDPILPEQHRAWFEAYWERDDDFVFVIEELVALKKPVGQVALYRVDWLQRKAEFGRLMIGDLQARGLGLARRATQLLLDHAERNLRLREVYLEVFETNDPALAIYRACGFVETQRQAGIVAMARRAAE